MPLGAPIRRGSPRTNNDDGPNSDNVSPFHESQASKNSTVLPNKSVRTIAFLFIGGLTISSFTIMSPFERHSWGSTTYTELISNKYVLKKETNPSKTQLPEEPKQMLPSAVEKRISNDMVIGTNETRTQEDEDEETDFDNEANGDANDYRKRTEVSDVAKHVSNEIEKQMQDLKTELVTFLSETAREHLTSAFGVASSSFQQVNNTTKISNTTKVSHSVKTLNFTRDSNSAKINTTKTLHVSAYSNDTKDVNTAADANVTNSTNIEDFSNDTEFSSTFDLNTTEEFISPEASNMTESPIDTDMFTNTEATDAKVEPTQISNLTSSSHGQQPACTLNPKGPVPVALVTMGRSGSSSIWQVMGTLTGYYTKSVEYTGSDRIQSRKFLEKVSDDDNGNWALKYMCEKQREYARAGIIGFKWKPFSESFLHPKSLAALRMIARSKDPQIKIVRSKRNGLDRTLSVFKHRQAGGAPAHCKVGDRACLEAHKRAARGLVVPIDDMMKRLKEEYQEELMVDQVLQELGVPHVYVSFEELFYGKALEEEWARIFEFLGVGPTSNLTREMVEKAMMHAATSNPFHNQTIANFEEVQAALKGTKFEKLLH